MTPRGHSGVGIHRPGPSREDGVVPTAFGESWGGRLRTQVSPRVRMLLTHARLRPTDEAAELLLAEIGDDDPPPAVVRRLADTVQFEIGRSWQLSQISAVEEHLATVVVEHALSALERRSTVLPRTRHGRIVLVCPEGEIHTLAARMAAVLLRWDGWESITLGGPAPPEDLRDWLAQARPAAVAISCVTSLGLRGLLDVAAAAEEAGVPCVAGGSGIGPDDSLARRLGVRWAARPEDIVEALAQPVPHVDPGDLADRVRRCDDLRQIVPTTVSAACIRLSLDVPDLRFHTDRDWDRTRGDLSLMLRFLAAALLAADDAVLTEFLVWQQVASSSRGLPEQLLSTRAHALLAVLPRRNEAARDLLIRAVDRALRSM